MPVRTRMNMLRNRQTTTKLASAHDGRLFRRQSPGWFAEGLVLSAVALFAVGVLSVGFDAEDPGSPISYVFVAIAVGLVAVRSRAPHAALVGIALLRVALTVSPGHEFALYAAFAVAAYSYVVRGAGAQRTNLVTALAISFVAAVAIAALSDEAFLPEFSGECPLMALPVLAGDAIRTRRDRIAELVERRTESRVQAERLRIAHDLHDIVAHSLSTIAVQSGIASHLHDADPGQAVAALDSINATSKHALEDLRSMLGVLRSTDKPLLNPIVADPNDFSQPLRPAREAGLRLHVDVIGVFAPTAANSSVLACHRIIQEALTNVARHAGAVDAVLAVIHGPDMVTISVKNDAPTEQRAPVPSTGAGIAGMAERAEAAGGTLVARPRADGGFEVHAVLPYTPPPT